MANVLGINISDLNADQIKIKLSEALAGKDQCFITTPNPEIILQSHKDEELFFILNQADLSIADGFGLKVAGLFYNEKIPRLTGADLSIDLLALAKESGKRVAVINWRGGLSNRSDIEKALSKKYPSLKTLVLDLSRFESTAGLSDLVINRLNVFSPDIIFCTFGSPYQEKALYHSLKKLPSVKLALGCGGAFDFITGKLSRAPLMFRKAGLEWLWRLMKQPSRIKRIINAVVVFSWKLIAAKFYTRFRYRPNVACLLYKKGDQGVKILIVERADAKNHWQLPQGGTDGESVEIAGALVKRIFHPSARFGIDDESGIAQNGQML